MPVTTHQNLAKATQEEMKSEKEWDRIVSSPKSQRFLEKMGKKIRMDIKEGRTIPLP